MRLLLVCNIVAIAVVVSEIRDLSYDDVTILRR